MPMKLEINARGSWRSLIEFDAEMAPQVKSLSHQLLALDGNPPKARLVGGTGKVLGYWIDSTRGWHNPGFLKQLSKCR